MENNNGRFVEEFGTQGELLVLVHGLGGSTNTWYPQTQILKRDLRIVAYDLPGSGRTPLREDVTIESLVADLHDVVERSGGTARVHLAGHSLGTIICQHYAARYADRVASLALIGAFPEPPEPARKALRDRAAKVRAEGMASIADAIVAAGTSDDTKANNPAAASFVRESIMAQPAEGYARACEALSALKRADLSGVRCPALLLTGDQDRTSPPDTGATLAGTIPGAEFRVLDGCGHWAPIERAKQVNYALTLFYSRQRSSKAA
jgi:pimeloyl-ACP methyl ester carboxylesterase